MLEKPHEGLPTWKSIWSNSEPNVLSNAFVAFLFMHTGPIAILLSAAQTGGLSEREMVSWLFAGYGVGGLLTVGLSLLYRQPIALAWSLPAAAIAGASLQHLAFPQVIGAYLATGFIITLLSLTGLTKKVLDFIPLPISMGMIAGVFLPFCLKLVSSFILDPWLAAVTVGSFFLFSSEKLPVKILPPVLISAMSGAALIALRGDFSAGTPVLSIVHPVLYTPQFNLRALLELVFPLTVSVIGIHNIQGITILKKEGYNPPVNTMTLTCGAGSIIMGLLGSVPTCITGPVSALLNSSGRKNSRYVGSLYLGLFMIISGLFAPVTMGLALMAPSVLIALLGGLALLRVLQDAFQSAFKNSFALGALVSFMVTVSDITFLNIGSAFWGLAAGCLLSLIMEMPCLKKRASSGNAIHG